MLRAWSFRSSGTASSRSRMTAPAPHWAALGKKRSWLAGTYSNEWIMIQPCLPCGSSFVARLDEDRLGLRGKADLHGAIVDFPRQLHAERGRAGAHFVSPDGAEI